MERNETREHEITMTPNIQQQATGAADCGCPSLEARLGSSLEVTITPEELEELQAELQGCPPCLEFVESLKTTLKLCRDFGIQQDPTPLPADTRNKMAEAYERMLARRSSANV